jgi:hypothetical protein
MNTDKVENQVELKWNLSGMKNQSQCGKVEKVEIFFILLRFSKFFPLLVNTHYKSKNSNFH